MPRHTLPAYGAALQLGLTQTLLIASLPLLVSRTGVSYQQWSWCLGATLLLYVLAAPFWGRQIDHRGAERTQRITAIGTVLCNALLCAALLLPEPRLAFATILLSRIGYALFASGQYPCSQAAVMASVSAERVQRVLGQLLATNHCGRLLGPVLVGLLAGLSLALPMLALVLLGGLLLGATLWTTRGGGTPPAALGDSAARPVGAGSFELWPALAAAFLVTFSVSYLQFALSASLGDRFALTPEQASQLLSGVLVVATVATLLSHLGLLRLLGAAATIQLAVLALCLVVGCLLLQGDFSRGALFAAIALLAIAHALSSPAYTAWARNRDPARSGHIAALLMTAHTLGHGIGTITAGTTAAALPLGGVVTVCALMQVALMSRLLLIAAPAPDVAAVTLETASSEPRH